jgi:hypothetical protein
MASQPLLPLRPPCAPPTATQSPPSKAGLPVVNIATQIASPPAPSACNPSKTTSSEPVLSFRSASHPQIPPSAHPSPLRSQSLHKTPFSMLPEPSHPPSRPSVGPPSALHPTSETTTASPSPLAPLPYTTSAIAVWYAGIPPLSLPLLLLSALCAKDIKPRYLLAIIPFPSINFLFGRWPPL